MVKQWVKDICDDVMKSESKNWRIGQVVKHPKGYKVKILGGEYWGDAGLSNFWYWRKVLPGGKLGKAEYGYGW